MSHRPPIIGVSACIFHQDPERITFNGRPLVYLEHSMADMLFVHGALPWLIPPSYQYPEYGQGLGPLDLLDHIDGLLLQGGVDMAPESYGESPLRPEWSGDARRDAYEMALVEQCVLRNIPVLGICRGHQVINVTLGGTLYQDISTQHEGALVHRRADIYEMNLHQLDIVEGSRLSQLYDGITQATINSVHHQGVKNIGYGLLVEARCQEDSIIEAIRLPQTNPDDPYVVGVQWHPEFQHPHQNLLPRQPLIEDFLQAVKHRISTNEHQ